MAATFHDEDRMKRMQLVVDYILETGASYRETAKFFSEHFFKISHVTVKDYCDRFIVCGTEKAEALKAIIESHVESNEFNDTVKERVLQVARIYTSSDYDVAEIAENLGLSFWTTYYDIYKRLPQIDTEDAKNLLRLVNMKSKKNSLENLRNSSWKKK